MTIYEIKRQTADSAPFYFSRKTMSFFGQTLRDFSVIKQPDGRYKISAPVKDKSTGQIISHSVRYFNPETKNLDII